ncbi:zinc finger and BTB domain-containing protein 17 [Eurytemora carolleeae]|uniref:zinc finger and BTB domain-containing protein 17 n=1 Tax=Eurytemora carolleeae TaxID=1294199 RepID=UPI000C75CBEB|nr:zinc finger and BTB domain-containing protein 17 [Eurytemora carolleeae]|eukprot:XP_023335213.1 zinc finger and BTB domain-containing protein 17-like [Eurytemora affinis]
MYVPDPGLMSKIQTLLSVGDSFMDTQISCSDGPIFWNSLLLAASSKYLKEMLAGSDASDDLVLILPNFSRNLVFQSLRKLVELGTLEFTTREKELLHILGVVHKDDFRSKGKVVQILSSSNFHNPHYRPVLVSEGDDEDDENDVDIIFENDSDGSESRDELDGKDDEVEMTDDEDEVRITAEDDENENNTYLNWEVSKLDDDDPNMTIDSLSSYYDGITEKEKPEEETKNVEATKKEVKTKTNTCRGCNKRFDNSEYKEHIAKFPEHANSKLKPRSELVCRLCNIDFKIKGLTAFREHVTKHRNMDGDFSCKECGKKTNKWGHLMQHMYRHGWKRPFNCDLCNYSTINKSNLVNHINIKHEKPDSRDFICPQCDKQFKSSNIFLV